MPGINFSEMEQALLSGESYWANNDFLNAFHTYKKLFFKLLQNQKVENVLVEHFKAIDIVIIDRLVDLSILFGHFEGATDILKSLISLNSQVNNEEGVNYFLIKHIELSLIKGDIREAYIILQEMAFIIGEIDEIEFSQTGLEEWEKKYILSRDFAEKEILLPRLYAVMGRILLSLGQYDNALSAFNRGVKYSTFNKNELIHLVNLSLKLYIAIAFLEAGNFNEARRFLEVIQSEFDLKTNPTYQIQWLEVFGKLNLLQGQFGIALETFNLVIELSQKYQFERAIMIAQLNLAHIKILLNQTNEANQLIAQVITNSERKYDFLSQRAQFLHHIAQARSHSLFETVAAVPSNIEFWNPSKYIHMNLQMPVQLELEELPQSTSYLSFFEDRLLSFQWKLGLGNMVEASNSFYQIIEVFETTDSDLIQIRIRAIKGYLAYYSGELELAEEIFMYIAPMMKALNLKPELWQILRILSWCKIKLERPRKEREEILRETNQLLSELTFSLPEIEQTIYQLNKWTEDEEYIAMEIDQLITLRQRCNWWNPWSRFKLLQRLNLLVNHIEKYKKNSSKDILYENFVESEKHSIPLWKRLFYQPKERLTISFLVLPDRLFIVASRKFSLNFGITPVTRIQVRDLVSQLHKIMQNQNWAEGSNSQKRTKHNEIYRSTGFDEPDIDLNNMHQEVGKTINQYLQISNLLENSPKHVTSLVFIPDDSLHGIPFSVIPHQGKYLVERYSISISYQMDNLKESNYPTSNSPKALIIGVSKGNGVFNDLPGTKKELNQIETWLKKHEYQVSRLESDGNSSLFTKSNIATDLSRVNFFHIACHGIFEPNHPDQSGFVLINQSGQTEILSLRDLSGIDMSGLKHATLSCCWSADNFILPGRRVISLPETLCQAGAHSVLGSLWPIFDNFAIAFYTQFYKYLEYNARDKALQKTQIDCINGELPLYKSINTSKPIYWASFNLYGLPGYLKL